MKVKQIGMDFLPFEDRMMLKIGTEPASDLKFWITRRYFKIMWEALLSALERHLSADRGLGEAARRALLAMQQQEKLAKTDFNQPFQDVTLNPGPAEAPRVYPVLFGISVSQQKPDLWKVVLMLRNKRSVDINLNDDMILSLCALMQRTLGAAEWDLKLKGLEAVAAPVDVGERRVVH